MKSSLGQDLKDFTTCLSHYTKSKFLRLFQFLESSKSRLAARLYFQRGRYARPFIHSGMALLILGGITLGPTLIAESFPGLAKSPWEEALPPSAVLSAAIDEMETSTLVSIKPRSEIIEYEVQQGDTVSDIAEKFGVSIDTIRWANKLNSIKDIKPGQKLKILPVTGLTHQVGHGETIYSIAKKYSVDAQTIVNWPYNSYSNDETFALAAGQTLVVPDGVMPKEIPWVPQQYVALKQAPAGGTAAGTGNFVWPAGGRITQRFVWYHKGLDIANKDAPSIVAADAGKVISAGWLSGYGNQVTIDHGSGMATLYGHMTKLYVSAGQTVSQGQALGQMGATGRATGIHLHFEIRKSGAAQDPLAYLK